MTSRPAAAPAPEGPRAAIVAAVAVLLFGLLGAGLVALVALNAGPPAASARPSGHVISELEPAPALSLTDQDGRPFTLGTPGRPTLVFFGYTHCPDVCPETVGVLTEAVAQAGAGPQALFISIDPERDDVAAMQSYTRYLPDWLRGPPGGPAQDRGETKRGGGGDA